MKEIIIKEAVRLFPGDRKRQEEFIECVMQGIYISEIKDGMITWKISDPVQSKSKLERTIAKIDNVFHNVLPYLIIGIMAYIGFHIIKFIEYYRSIQ